MLCTRKNFDRLDLKALNKPTRIDIVQAGYADLHDGVIVIRSGRECLLLYGIIYLASVCSASHLAAMASPKNIERILETVFDETWDIVNP
jgi:hypothetical protein